VPQSDEPKHHYKHYNFTKARYRRAVQFLFAIRLPNDRDDALTFTRARDLMQIRESRRNDLLSLMVKRCIIFFSKISLQHFKTFCIWARIQDLSKNYSSFLIKNFLQNQPLALRNLVHMGQVFNPLILSFPIVRKGPKNMQTLLIRK